MELDKKIEAVLFWKGEPMSRAKLCDIFKVHLSVLDEALLKLKTSLENRGVVLQENGDEIAFGTSPELSVLFEELQKEEVNKDLSKASLETLSVILYKNGATRAEIDYVRGVNSSFILRALAIRGLIQKEIDPNDSRKLIYKPTFDLLSYLGVKSVEELPDYMETIKVLNNTTQKMQEENIQTKEKEEESILNQNTNQTDGGDTQ
ncbi:MAG: SMC-Scp complex subunit ScpB [Candidatus Pacebacteria bacterium]|nr:SMC-Scp complex subunit ScpB [Candidatus Paceibacterota bacterium]MCF7862874.1 SMC-Scp complex subunit ScpB [Candidatus Paceibacterota bacterium]